MTGGSRAGTRAQRRRGESGFTLTEMMVSFAIFTTVITLAFGQLSKGISQTADLDRAANAKIEARFALDLLVSELRQASTSDDDLEPIAAIAPDSITFYTPDRATPKHLRKVIYRVSGGDLQRSEVLSVNAGLPPWTFPGAASPFRTVLSDVVNTTIFSYLDSAAAVASTPDAVTSVVVEFQIKSLLLTGSNDVFRTTIDIRSRE